MNEAIKIHEKDDVLIALRPFKKGEVVEGLTLLSDIPQGHKIALRDLPAGHRVLKYGNVIGILSAPVKKGEWIHSHNLRTSLEERPIYHYAKETVAPVKASSFTWKGFLRFDGRAGVRNDLYLIPTVGCINGTVESIKTAFIVSHPEMAHRVMILTHPYGCSQLGDDLSNTRRLLSGLASNPNAGGVLVIGLGCENNRLAEFMPLLNRVDPKRLRSYNAQEVADDVAYGLSMAEELYDIMKKDVRVDLPLSKLSIGLKCGGSDGLSGLTANPLVGLVSDLIGGAGAQVALTEVPEMFGAEQALMNRARDEGTYHKIISLINDFKDYYAANHQPCYENPSPGNKDGGITTLEEKSSGCILKGGHLEVEDVLKIGEPLIKGGLNLIDGPGNDIVASTNVAAAGASILIFTTGRGTPFGSIIPTIKVATNHTLASSKPSWIDYDGERAFDLGFPAARDELLALLLRVASGEETQAEKHGIASIALFKSGVTL